MNARNQARKQATVETLFDISEQSLQSMMFAAGLAYSSEQYENALIVYTGVSAARPTWSRPVVGIGICLYRLGRVEEAEAAYRKAITLDPSDQQAHLYLGELIWNERKDAATSEASLGKAVQIEPKTKVGVRARYILSLVRRETRAR